MIINNSSDKETGYIPGVYVSKEELRGRLDRLEKEINAYKNTPWYGADSQAPLSSRIIGTKTNKNMNEQNKEKESSNGFNAAGYLMETALFGERNMRKVLAGIYGAKDSYKAQREQSDKQASVKESDID